MEYRVAATAFVCIALATTVARADGTNAEDLYDQAAKAHARGDDRAAAAAFEASYKLAAHGATIYNAAISWEAAGEAPRAADDYALALAAPDLDDPDHTAAAARLAALDKTLGRISLEAPAGASSVRASIDGTDPHDVPATLHTTVRVLPGPHTIAITFADGTTRNVTVEATAGAETPVDLSPPSPAPPLHPSAPGSSPAKTIGWISMGTGIAAMGAGYIVGAIGLNANDQYNASGHTNASLQSEALTCLTWANVLIISGAVVGVTGLVLVLTSGRHTPTGATAWLRVGPGSIGAGGSF